MTHAPEPNPLQVLLSSGGGDVCAARDCALALLAGVGGGARAASGARLLLSAVCLQLYPITGPDPTLRDVYDFLLAMRGLDAFTWARLETSPLPLVQYAFAEFDRGGGPAAREAISLAIQALKLRLHTNA